MNIIRRLRKNISSTKKYRIFNINKFDCNYKEYVTSNKSEDSARFYFVQTFSYRNQIELEPIDKNFRFIYPALKIKKEQSQENLYLEIDVGYRNLFPIFSYSLLFIILTIYILYNGEINIPNNILLMLVMVMLLPILVNYQHFLYKRKQLFTDFVLFILEDVEHEEI